MYIIGENIHSFRKSQGSVEIVNGIFMDWRSAQVEAGASAATSNMARAKRIGRSIPLDRGSNRNGRRRATLD